MFFQAKYSTIPAGSHEAKIKSHPDFFLQYFNVIVEENSLAHPFGQSELLQDPKYGKHKK